MKEQKDRVGGSVGLSNTADPGVSLFWLDDSFDGAMPMTATTPVRRPQFPVPVQQIPDESATRSALKTLSWRLLATVTTVVVIYVLTENGDLAITVGYMDAILKMGLYYFHERFWNRMRTRTRKIRT